MTGVHLSPGFAAFFSGSFELQNWHKEIDLRPKTYSTQRVIAMFL